MGDIGLWKQGLKWVQSRKQAFPGTRVAVSSFLVDRHWSMVSRLCVGLWRVVLMGMVHWRDCAVKGFWGLVNLDSTGLFVILWSCFLGFTSTTCLIYVLLSLGIAGSAIHFLGSTPGLFIVGSFGILIMWIYGNFWMTGMLVIVGGYVFSMNHARFLIFMSIAYAVYFLNVRIGWVGVLLSLNLSFISNDLLNKLLRGYEGATESTHFEEQEESEPFVDYYPEDPEYSPPTSEAENVTSSRASCRTSTIPNMVKVQKDASSSKVVKTESTSMDEMRRIMNSSNHYEALGFPRHKNIDPLTLKKEYRRMAVLVHPDKNMGNPLASESFKKIQCAHEVLSDLTKKKNYDDQLRKEETRRVFQNCGGTSQRVEIPRAFVCAESKIFDVSEWAICQGMMCKPNTHKPSFHVSMVALNMTVQRSNPSRYPWSLDAEMNPEDDEFELWLQQALASGVFSDSPKRRKSWTPFKITTPKGLKQWRRSP